MTPRPPAPGAPRRLLRRPEAAAYCGVSAGTFARWVADGRMPAALKVDSLALWDVRELDAAIDRLHEPAAPAQDEKGWD